MRAHLEGVNEKNRMDTLRQRFLASQGAKQLNKFKALADLSFGLLGLKVQMYASGIGFSFNP